MKLPTLLLTSMYFLQIQSSEFNKDFYPPPWPKPKETPSDSDAYTPVFLGRDKESGCLCREVPGKWVVCFGGEQCRTFPRRIAVRSSMLRVKTTAIETLRKGDLGNMTQLVHLEIEGNTVFRKIEGGAFLNMGRLTNLSVSYNKELAVLEPNAFEGLVNLKHLYLVQNGFKHLKHIAHAFTPSYLPKLFKLGLSENVFRNISATDLKPMEGTHLQELNLILCQIEHMDPHSLAPLKNLKSLRLGENSFNTTTVTNVIQSTIDMKIPLRTLNLYGIGLRKSPPKKLMKVIAGSNITNLCLARNQFELVKETSFPLMPHVEILDLREVLALNVTSMAFKGMPSLRTLLLGGNKLSSVPDGVLLEQLTYLDLSSNSGDVFFPTYFSLGNGRFRNMKRLNLLNLSYNRINTIFNDTFTGLTNLLVLGLKNATLFHIGRGSFATLTNLVFLNLENNPFGLVYGLPEGMFEGLAQLEVLLLGGCSIKHLDTTDPPFANLKRLKHLGLQRNKLLVVSPAHFLSLGKLISLDVSENFLSTWHVRMFGLNSYLRKVVATRNKITYLSEEMLVDFQPLKSLDVSENPLSCDCNTFNTMQKFVKNHKDGYILELLKGKGAYCVYPETYSNTTLSNFLTNLQNTTTTTTKTCETHQQNVYAIIFIPLTILVIISAVLTALIYRFRWHIRYWIFLSRLHLGRTLKLKPNPTKRSLTTFEYDAFVSYCNEDRNFVVRLVAMLENYEPFIKLCVYERDFQAGSLISESVLESVARSRKTLLIVSDAYARSQWCRWETQIAEHHRLFFVDEYGEYVDDSLVLIKLGAVCERHVTPTLKYLLKTRVYLQWDSDAKKQAVFWMKLRTALVPKNVKDVAV